MFNETELAIASYRRARRATRVAWGVYVVGMVVGMSRTDTLSIEVNFSDAHFLRVAFGIVLMTFIVPILYSCLSTGESLAQLLFRVQRASLEQKTAVIWLYCLFGWVMAGAIWYVSLFYERV